ncbi:MAG: DUF3563 family protein [Rhizobiaceae bacterium]|nr:DUF3563 family protein [Rhizobiaceae bacterium]
MTIASKIRAAFAFERTANRQERYLAEATSLADLELRQREIDRGRFARN